MSHVREDRRVEGDWWPEPVPPNVEFAEGFYCESTQIFRKLRSKKPRAVVIGKHVSCYAGCSFAIGDTAFHPLEPAQRLIDAQALAPYFKNRPGRPTLKTALVKICDNVWIGMNAVILKGVTIGENSVVAAGSVVTKSVEPNTIVAGNPAQVVKTFTK